MRRYCYRIGPGEAGMTVGDYLRRRHGFSARMLTKLRHSPRGILVGGVHARTVDLLRAGDELTVDPGEPEKEIVPSPARVPVLYEDGDLLVFDKPAGMACHTSCGHYSDTLENVWAAHCLRSGEPVTALRPLGRLDTDTSGCVLAAKNRYVASRLKGRYGKLYCALAEGTLWGSGRVDGAIYRPDPIDMHRTVDPRGQPSATEYTALASGGGHSLLLLRIATGRTHQIRVHMAHLGHPLAGDAFYGGGTGLLSRQALHCLALEFCHPVGGEDVRAVAPLPQDLRAACARCGIDPNLAARAALERIPAAGEPGAHETEEKHPCE